MRSLWTLSLLLLLTGCQVSLLGGKELRDSIKPTDPMWLGCAAASVLVHEGGHIAVMEAKNIPYDFNWDGSFAYQADSLSDKRSVGRAGFLTQIGGSYVLKSINAKQECQDGYNWATSVEFLTYSLRRGGNSGDFKYLSAEEQAVIGGFAVGIPLLKVTW